MTQITDERGVVWRHGDQGWQYYASDGRWYRTTKAPRDPGEFDFHPAGGYVAMGGGILVAVSSLLPWWTAGVLGITVTRNGYQLGTDRGFSPDGAVVLVLGLFVVAVGVGGALAPYGPAWLRTRGIGIAAAIGGTLALLLMILETVALNGSIRGDPVVSLGYGLWIMAIGAVVVGAGGLMMATMPRKSYG